ncbi:MAG: hypothetical protein L6R45_14460 [Anaerolineae bacterium]|nr:hypothetical protein [Anaerolineae bacterium]
MADLLTSLAGSLRDTLPLNSSFRRLLRQSKADLNELLWTIKPDWPQLGEPTIQQLHQIMKASAKPEINLTGKRVLIFSMRAWRIHNVWEGLIGRGLLERGANPTVVVCDGLPRCDLYAMDTPGYSSDLCQSCLNYTRQLFHFFGLPVQTLSNFLKDADRNEAKIAINSWTNDYESFVAEDLPLGELAAPSLMRTLLRGSIEKDARSTQIYKEYLEAGFLITRMFNRMLDMIEPDTLIMINGLFFAENIGLTLAKKRQIHTVTHERAFMVDRLVLAHDRAAAWYRIDEAWRNLKDIPLESTQEVEIDNYLRQRETGRDEIINYWPSVEERKDFIIHQLRLDPHKPILTLFPNILWDTAVFQSDVAFDNMFDWLEYTIHEVSQLSNLQLIIRVHPAEVRIPHQESRERVIDRLAQTFPSLPSNVILVTAESNISSYVLIALSKAISVYTSTIGLEGAVRGVPVLLAGNTHYRNKGFTYDIESREQYSQLIQNMDAGKLSWSESVTLAQRYAHIFFLRSMLPMSLVTEGDGYDIRFNFQSFDALKPGQDKILDHICQAILERKDFVLE